MVGSPDFVIGFRLAGIRKAIEADHETIGDKIDELLDRQDVGILVVNLKDVERLPVALRTRIDESTTPVVIPVGTEEGDMRDKVRRAIGVDLYKGA